MSRLKKLVGIALGLLTVAVLVNCLYHRHSVVRLLRGQSRFPAEMGLPFRHAETHRTRRLAAGQSEAPVDGNVCEHVPSTDD